MTIPGRSFFQIETGSNIKKVQEMLGNKISGEQSLNPLSFPSQPFVGEIYSDGFHIRHAVWYSRTLIPVFHGSFNETEDGVAIRVETHNGFATVNALACWLGSTIEIVAALLNLLHANYRTAAILFSVSAASAVSATLIGRLYRKKLNDGTEELTSMWKSATKGGRTVNK
jgi:hypothetical protein